MSDVYLKEFLHFLPHDLIVDIRVHDPAHQIVDRVHDLRHLVLRDVPVAVYVVERECPSKFLFERPPREDGETRYEFLQKIDI